MRVIKAFLLSGGLLQHLCLTRYIFTFVSVEILNHLDWVFTGFYSLEKPVFRNRFRGCFEDQDFFFELYYLLF